MFCPSNDFVMNFGRGVWLHHFRLKFRQSVEDVEPVKLTYIDQIPSPHLTFLVATNHSSLGMAETSAATIGLIDMAREVVQHLPCSTIHEAYVVVESGNKIGLGILSRYHRCYRFCQGGLYWINHKEQSFKDARPIKSERSSPIRRSYVRTCPSTEPAMIYVCPTWRV